MTRGYLCLIGVFAWVFLLIPAVLTLDCLSVQLDDSAKVECTAKYFTSKNECNETVLSEKYEHLYGEDLYPGRPHNLHVQPFQEIYPGYPGYYPGFHVTFMPPRTADFQYVRGFQLNYHSEGSYRCIILQIINVTLSSIHKVNELGLNVKIYPLAARNADFTFTAYSLPTPKDDEKEVQTRYGKTTELWESGSPSSRWKTTISYYINQKEKYIQFWFAPAPDELKFYIYEITLEKVLANESTNVEVRNLTCCTPPLLINKTDYIFSNLEAGRYRVGVQPYDDTGRKCKNQYGASESCLKTITAVIDIPDDGTSIHSTTFTPMSSLTSSPTRNPTEQTEISVSKSPEKSEEPDSAILPSVLGVVAFIVVVTIAAVCFKINKDRFKDLISETRQRPQLQGLNNSTFDFHSMDPGALLGQKPKVDMTQHGQHMAEKTVAIIATDDDESHTRVVSAFALYLQKRCHCNVQYFPWNTAEDKFRWIANTLEMADFHVFVASESAVNQYESWKHKKLQESKDLFIPYLSKYLNRFDYSHKFLFVRFDHSSDVLMPDDLCTSQYPLMQHFTEFLSHIHGLNPYKDDLKNVNLPLDQDLTKTKEGRDLSNAIHLALKTVKPKQSRLDSGYKSHNENCSFDEQEWREVKQKYVLDKLIQQQPREEVFGAFLIGEESRSLMPGDQSDLASIAPAITIAEGGGIDFNTNGHVAGQVGRKSGEAGHVIQSTINPPQHQSLFAVNKYGSEVEPNIHPHKYQDGHPRINTGSYSNCENIQAGDQHILNQEESFTGGPDYLFDFLPPDSSMLDEDITTQYQFEIMEDINKKYLKSTRSEPDNSSGYSV